MKRAADAFWVGFLTINLVSLSAASAQQSTSGVVIRSFGGEGGGPFDSEYVSSIGLRTGDIVDALILNGRLHGTNGGTDRGALQMSLDEYIAKIDIRSGAGIDRLTFYTNKGRMIGGGGNGGSPSALDHIRLLAIGGRSGGNLDKLQLTYIENYQASVPVESKASFIISYSPPNEEFVQYASTSEKRKDSYEKITESMVEKQFSASVEGEYYAKVSASTNLTFRDTSTTTIKSELERSQDQSASSKMTIPAGSVGIKVVLGTLMKGTGTDEYWMFPTSEPQYSIIKLSEIEKILNYYDITGNLASQMDGLTPHKTIRNGFIFYQ